MSKLYGVQKQQLRGLSKNEFSALRELCFLSKNMYNVALYNVRQNYFETKKYLSYESNYHLCKGNENYKLLNTDAAQQTIKQVDEAFQSFFGLVTKPDQKPRIPTYLEKDGLFDLSFPRITLQKDGTYFLPMSPAFRRKYGKIKICFPTNLNPKDICEVRILPRFKGSFFEVEYVYKITKQNVDLDISKALSIDFGIDNLASCITTDGASFLMDGKRLKSFNHWYNKTMSKIQSKKDLFKVDGYTKRQAKLTNYRNNFVRDYLNKTAFYIADYCIKNNIGKLIVGYNKGWKNQINLGKATNQNFVQIPHGQLKNKLKTMSERFGITFVEQEESYTSKASFIDGDSIPVYGKDKTKHSFSGKRVKRGLYQTKDKSLVNADLNGAANILCKSKHKFLKERVSSGLLASPTRIYIP